MIQYLDHEIINRKKLAAKRQKWRLMDEDGHWLHMNGQGFTHCFDFAWRGNGQQCTAQIEIWSQKGISLMMVEHDLLLSKSESFDRMASGISREIGL